MSKWLSAAVKKNQNALEREGAKGAKTPHKNQNALEQEGAKGAKHQLATLAPGYSGTFQKKPRQPEAANTHEAEPTYHGFSMADLEAEASPDEWAEVRDNPKALTAFALALLEDRQIQAGIKPERFTALRYCPGCGVVALPTTYPANGEYEPLSIPQVNGCRWCGNRMAGKHYPKAYPLPPNGYDRRKKGRWPWSEQCRPLVWQGFNEKQEAI